MDTLPRRYFMEINNDNIDQIVRENKNVVINLITPGCSSVNYTLLREYNNYFSTHWQNIKYFSISETYDLQELLMLNDVIKTKGVVFILEDGFYGHKIKKIKKKFNAGLIKFDDNKVIGKSTDYFNTYIFKEGKLLISSNEISVSKIDSIFNFKPH